MRIRLPRITSATTMLRQGRRCVAERPESLLFKLTDGDMNRVTAKLVTDCAMQGDNIAFLRWSMLMSAIFTRRLHRHHRKYA